MILKTLIGLLYLFLSITFSLFGVLSEEKLLEVDEEINILKKELRKTELEAMKKEVISENYMKYEWDRYTDEIEKAEKLDQRASSLTKKIEALQDEKEALIKKMEK